MFKFNPFTGKLDTVTDVSSLPTASFTTIATPAGTSPVADSATDTLTLSSSDSFLTITGDSSTDTVDFTRGSGFNELVDDRVAALIQNGTGLTWTYNDPANTLTGNVSLSAFTTDNLTEGSTNLYFTNERAQDAVGNILTDTASIDFTYSDAGNTISAAVLPAGVNHNALANLTTGDPHTQYIKQNGTVLDKEIATWNGSGGRDLNVVTGIKISGSVLFQIAPTALNANLLLDGNGTGVVQLNSGASSQQFPKSRVSSVVQHPVLTEASGTGAMSWVNAMGQVSTAGGTDNRLVRWDNVSTLDPLIQDSAVTLDDSGGMSGLTQLNCDNLRLDGNTLSTTNSNGDLLLTPNGTGNVVAGTSVGELDFLCDQMSLLGSGISSTNVLNVNATTTLRNFLAFTITSQQTSTSTSGLLMTITDQGTNASNTVIGAQGSITLDTTNHTTYTQTGVRGICGTSAGTAFSSGTYTFHGVRAGASSNGSGGTHTGGTVRLYGFFQDAITAYTGATNLIMGACFQNDVCLTSDTKLILENSTTVKGDSYLVFNSATTDIDLYVDGTQVINFDNDFIDSKLDFKLTNVGTGIYIKEGTNATMGTATLAAGTVVVNTSKVTANSRIFLTNEALGGTAGFLRVSARTGGTSFTITSSNALDTSTVAWVILEPA